jgi:IS30 family transposase
LAKISTKATNERRQQVWFLMLRGHNAQSMSKTLNVSHVTIYTDIKFLTKKSKQYVYDMAKGLHALSYQKSIEGISLALSEAWNKFNDPIVPEKQRVAYLRLIKECNESIYTLTANGPCVLAMQDLTKRIERAGISVDIGFNSDPDDK